MGDELVTGESPNKRGGGKGRRPLFSRYTDTFEEVCGYYLSLGMSYSDFWDGDCEMVKYYRDADDRKRERENFNLWLQAGYIYQVLLDVSPALKPMVKHPKPRPFLKEPIPLTKKKAQEELSEDEGQRRMENGKTAMLSMAMEFNKNFKKKQEGGN